MCKIVLAVIINCIAYFSWVYSDLFTTVYIYLHYNYAFILGKTPLVIISALISFIGKKNLKEKIGDFIKIIIISYLCIWVIIIISFVNTMSNFD